MRGVRYGRSHLGSFVRAAGGSVRAPAREVNGVGRPDGKIA
jgi:hypothetical protein